MANEDLSLNPTFATASGNAKDAWWYEEPRGLHVVAELNDGTFAHVNISWAAVQNAVKRKTKKPAKKKKLTK